MQTHTGRGAATAGTWPTPCRGRQTLGEAQSIWRGSRSHWRLFVCRLLLSGHRLCHTTMHCHSSLRFIPPNPTPLLPSSSKCSHTMTKPLSSPFLRECCLKKTVNHHLTSLHAPIPLSDSESDTEILVMTSPRTCHTMGWHNDDMSHGHLDKRPS